MPQLVPLTSNSKCPKNRAFSGFICGVLLLAGGLITACSQLPSTPVLSDNAISDTGQIIQSPSLRLMSFNIAHGRSDSFSQAFLSEKTIRDNLMNVANFMRTNNVQIVGLQEADGPSAWSGNFDHVAFIAEHAGFTYHVRSEHVQRWWGGYGTGILSHTPLESVYSHTFKPSPPTTRKGFTLATVWWQTTPLMPAIPINIVSLHLDFSRDSVRHKQLHELLAVLEQNKNPLIIMGDFNSEKIPMAYLPQLFADQAQLITFDHPDNSLNSYGDKRLDWVVLSKELKFLDYQVEAVLLSDHRPVIVEIGLADALPAAIVQREDKSASIGL